MVMEDRERYRSWTLLSGQKRGTMTAIFAMKESCGTRGIISRFKRGFTKEMRNSSPRKEKIGVDGWALQTVEHKIEHMEKTPDDVRTREEAAARCTKGMKKKSAQETGKESQSGALSFKETSHGVICRRAFISLKMEQNGKKNHRSIVKVYTRIRKRQKKHRKNNLIFSD